MRPSLENIELIDKYLNGELSEKEKDDFEIILLGNTELQKQVEVQKELIFVARRMALKKEILAAKKSNKRFKFGKWGLILLALISAATLIFFVVKNQQDNNNNSSGHSAEKTSTVVAPLHPDSIYFSTAPAEHHIPQAPGNKTQNSSIFNAKKASDKSDEFYDFHGLKTWVQPDVQKFLINPAKGATIEGKEGTMIIVPANAFVDDQNKIVTNSVQLELVEALNLDDMVLYRLGTLSDGKMLESAGMFHIRATQNNKELKINPDKPLYIEVPARKVKPGMMAFEGHVGGEGTMNWQNPVRTRKFLINVPLYQLDFLPAGFTETVKNYLPYKNYTKAIKPMVDSLYYSLTNSVTVINDRVGLPQMKRNFWQRLFFRNKQDDTGYELTFDTVNVPQCSINPLSIKTIKGKEFNKTFIATREFEERMEALHTLENGEEMLQIYINNLNKDLCYSDSVIAAQLQGNEKEIFRYFAEQQLNNVKGSEIYQAQLSEFYSRKKQQYKEEKSRMERKLGLDTKVTIEEINEKIQQADSTTIAAVQQYLPKRTVASASYAFSWAKTGWVNIDAYLHLLSKGSIQVTIKLANQKGTTDVFQWLNTINNLTPLNSASGEAFAFFPLASEPEAEQMKNTYCFAISKDGNSYTWFEKKYNPYETAAITAELKEDSIENIRARLRYLGGSNDVLGWMEESRKAQKPLIAKPKIRKREVLIEVGDKTAELLNEILMEEDLKRLSFKCHERFLSTIGESQLISK